MLRFPFPKNLQTPFKFQTHSPLRHHHQLPRFLHLQPPKNSYKILHFQSTTMSSSWPCSKCTFLNPPSQKSTCQICHTPSNLHSSNSNSALEKWACKACTFLNPYSRSNCEICDTRAPLFNSQELDFFDVDDDFSGFSSVGTVFFPLRKCDSGRVHEPDDVGIHKMGQTQLGSHRDQGVGPNFGSNKRKLQDLDTENAAAVSYFPAKKEENSVTIEGVASAKIVGNADNVSFKKNLCDLGDFVNKLSNADGYREVKSSRKAISVIDSVQGSSLDKVGNVKTNNSSVSIENTENAEVKEVPGVIKILSYNVWFAEDLELHRRMQAIGDLIELHSPDVICFQEVTPDICVIFRNSTWWKKYHCSISNIQEISQAYFCMQLAKLPVKSFSSKQFSYSAMGRELSVAEVEVNKNKSLVVATSHLESPCPGPPTWDQMFSKERVNQAKEAVNFLQQYPNVIFCGDMNWDDSRDGRFPLADGWYDAWEKLRPAEIGYTYDTKTNKMLTGNRSLRKRLDRFVCCLTDFEIRTIDMIGTEEIPGVTYKKSRKLKNKIQELTCPVLPSDHFGLLLTITSS